MTKELLQQAHDALITSLAYVDATSAIAEVQGALKAIEQALAQQEQPAQEAVAYELEAVKFANGKKLVYQKPENLASYIKVRTLVYADADPAPTQPAQEPVVVLPDGSAFSILSLPLPADHWLYREREYATPKSEETVDLPPPFVPRTVENLELIRLAAKWAIRAATNCGKINDFDPDALVQNFVYATLGPYPQKIKDVPPTQPAFTQEQPAKTGARIQAIVTSCLGCTHRRYNSGGIYYCEKLGSDLDPRETFHPLCPLQPLSPTQPALSDAEVTAKGQVAFGSAWCVIGAYYHKGFRDGEAHCRGGAS